MAPVSSAQDWRARAALAVYIVCFGIGAVNHARDFVVGGLRPYRWGPPLLEAFWTSLIVLDSLVIVLLLARRIRLGLSLALAVMIADVAINSYAWLRLGLVGFNLPLQAAFMGFALGTTPFLWPDRAPRPQN
ncbi:CHASE2 domain-containing sensor protein [Sphingomonas naasensis]|uniref:DoxX family protein n=1 Tax=Sphingomonas naasensis TaxID=1344951 RepID=A0A4V3QX16_9SPHN|nr:hypothetical protein [Sphingomonas naasensis]NIJ20615.1 CHASE2 domain-containing sensor protein [Sphingomonas naasensis]TGX44692.1 hypothetical protein E5A74_08005 [Sphingomonas naasensis]